HQDGRGGHLAADPDLFLALGDLDLADPRFLHQVDELLQLAQVHVRQPLRAGWTRMRRISARFAAWDVRSGKRGDERCMMLRPAAAPEVQSTGPGNLAASSMAGEFAATRGTMSRFDGRSRQWCAMRPPGGMD